MVGWIILNAPKGLGYHDRFIVQTEKWDLQVSLPFCQHIWFQIDREASDGFAAYVTKMGNESTFPWAKSCANLQEHYFFLCQWFDLRENVTWWFCGRKKRTISTTCINASKTLVNHGLDGLWSKTQMVLDAYEKVVRKWCLKFSRRKR